MIFTNKDKLLELALCDVVIHKRIRSLKIIALCLRNVCVEACGFR